MDILSKYLEDIKFICWVFEPNDQLNSHWEDYLKQHPEETKSIQLARKLVLQFRAESKILSEEEKILLFSRILKQIEEKQQTRNSKQIFLSFAKYAAVALLFFSIGALLFYRPNLINPALQAFKSQMLVPGNEAQLIRSNGENIIMADQRSVISYQNDGAVIVNKDTLKSSKSDLTSNQVLNQLIIPYGKTSEVMLPDGTKVYLNAGSRLAYPDQFTGKSREVMLVGEAYFEVKHDSKHPFVVLVNELKIKDLGTEFNVSAYAEDNTIQTVLNQGSVSISRLNSGFLERELVLKPNQMASFNKTSSETKVYDVDASYYSIWTQGLLSFDEIDFNRVVKRV